MDTSSYFWILVVGAVWGGTNPLLRAGSRVVEQQRRRVEEGRRTLLTPLVDLWYLVRNWRFSLPLVINQTASMAFVALVASMPVSVVVPLVNSLQFLFTALVGAWLGEQSLDVRSWLGVGLVLGGIALMIYAG